MAERVLVTGGAGFIGGHLVRALLARGERVRVLDSLIEQVHGQGSAQRLPDDVELVRADVRDGAAVRTALAGVDKVVHLAAEVGVGQSMYAIDRYVSVNDVGTAVLFQALTERPVARVVVASSMSIYGEGLYRDIAGRLVEDATRDGGASWDPVDAQGHRLVPVATPEWKQPSLASVYALTKFAQERLTLTVAPAYGMQGVALRLFNVYGPGQALSNPYTGVLAIFAARLRNGQRPMVFEDGAQLRDFVHVADVARAFLAALDLPAAAGRVFNIGSGCSVSIADVARRFAAAMGRERLAPEITFQARTGDIRHCFADITLARERLGFTPQQDFDASLAELAAWVERRHAVDLVAQARRELEARGLVA
ncbi:SDR family NAD(P)-dependent oxidoreductase [Rhodovastum atsumiense]|uniref:SDR family NAD(P)-dependent oxidoreductase n=1 Tax=Rhodovastum atsumiense TaxID=504468 RepID=A0A5M6INU8_9PROT|nr:NAD-dependent epimerase/dehydratase family protein [Rhodovastum atsumiense]KAA5609930.1 SDR family NAD(P)-dependent oxidoreductase [Rhodovastum atsumiense]CAH2604549.1 SDR family NAD(P)-dependent oxidoreductase [Rhodovastum atsumiense]